MCVATLSDGEFDPELCPMLAGLSAAERARKLEQPWVKACIERRKARAAAGTGTEPVARVEPPVPCTVRDEAEERLERVS